VSFSYSPVHALSNASQREPSLRRGETAAAVPAVMIAAPAAPAPINSPRRLTRRGLIVSQFITSPRQSRNETAASPGRNVKAMIQAQSFVARKNPYLPLWESAMM
jgi:hypothetical protein